MGNESVSGQSASHVAAEHQKPGVSPYDASIRRFKVKRKRVRSSH